MLLYGWILAVFSACATAQKVGITSELGFGCWSASLGYNLSCPHEFTPFFCHCANNDFVSTSLACVHFYATTERQINDAYVYIQAQCRYWGGRKMSFLEMEDIYLGGLTKLVDPAGKDPNTIMNGTIMIPTDVFERELDAGIDAKFRYDLGTIFGVSFIAYWALIMLIATMKTALETYFPSTLEMFGARFPNWVRKVITMPALTGNKHHVPYRLLPWYSLSAPTRGQALIVLGFLGLNIFALTSFYDLNDNSPNIFMNNTDKVLRYLSNRTGIIAVILVPVTVLFACRNNPLIWITGWSYDTFQLYHRWNARMFGIHTVVHGVLLSIFSLREHVLIFKWIYVFNWRAGNMAGYSLIIMLILALRPIRRRAYEWFLLTHQILFMCVLICTMIHLSDYGWRGWVYATFIIYALEYFSRIMRMIYSGGIQTGTFTLASSDMFRLRVTGARQWKIRPGSYAYLRILKKNLIWQSHPFSVFQTAKGKQTDSLEMVIKGRDGATQEMVRHLASCEGQTDTFKVIIEGPYGRNNDLARYDCVFLLAGGVGITAMHSYVDSYTTAMGRGKFLSLVWVVNDEGTLDAFHEEVELLRKLQLLADIQIYVSYPKYQGTVTWNPSKGVSVSTDVASSINGSNASEITFISRRTSSEESNGTVEERIHLEDMKPKSVCTNVAGLDNIIHHGKPNLEEKVKTFITSWKGTMAICSCGPPSFVDSARGGIVRNIQNANSNVNYFEEAFSW